MNQMFKILGIFLILAAVSLSGCIGEDVPADEEVDVVIVDEPVDDVAEEPVDEAPVDDVVDEVPSADPVDEVPVDDDNTVGLDSGSTGTYNTVTHFTEARDDAKDAYNAAQVIADEANVTMIAAEEDVVSCQGLVDEGNALLANVSVFADALENATIATEEARAPYDEAEEAYIVAVQTALDAVVAYEEISAEIATLANETPVNTTELFRLMIEQSELEDESINSTAAVGPLEDAMDELETPFNDAVAAEELAQTAYDDALAEAGISALEMKERTDALADAIEAADSAKLTFETLQEAADEKFVALEAAEVKLASVL